jgi:hypothetical protein
MTIVFYLCLQDKITIFEHQDFTIARTVLNISELQWGMSPLRYAQGRHDGYIIVMY